MHAERARMIKNDWSEGEAHDGESLIEHDIKSIGSTDIRMGPSTNALQQNSLYSSIQGQQNATSISISASNSLQFPRGDSRIKQVSKGTHGVDEEATIGGST